MLLFLLTDDSLVSVDGASLFFGHTAGWGVGVSDFTIFVPV